MCFVTVPVRGIRLHHQHAFGQGGAAAVTVPVRGIRLHPAGAFTWTFAAVTVPVRGIRLHPKRYALQSAVQRLLSP